MIVSFTSEGESALLQAVGLALAIMRHRKVESWDGVVPEDVILLRGQEELLSSHAKVLEFLQPKMSVFHCLVCYRWGLMASGAAPRGCSLSLDCPGTPVKSKVATKSR